MEPSQELNESADVEKKVHEAPHAEHVSKIQETRYNHQAKFKPQFSDRIRIVVVGTETAVFDPHSPVRERILAYTEKFASTDIIVMCGGKFEKASPRKGVTLYPTNSRSRFRRVFDAVRIGKTLAPADVVTVQDPFETGLAGLLIARHLGAKLHVQVHTDFLSPSYGRVSPLNIVRQRIASYVIAHADRIRVVSEDIKQAIEGRYRPRAPISVLPIFVDIEKFKSASALADLVQKFAGYKTRLLVVSRLEQEKNVALAVTAFAKAAPKDACLIIVGDGRQHAALKRQAQDLGVMARVFFEGRQDAAPYYALADLVLVPSVYEGYGLVIIEALAAGKPVLSTDVGIAREAGAIVVTPEQFENALKGWFESGPHTGALIKYPYESFEAYVKAYGEDVAATFSEG